MPELFKPIAAEQLFAWVFCELDTHDSAFGIPRRHFFLPRKDPAHGTTAFGHRLETPFGPAAGPHTQMAQNIVSAWLCGARYIELKTVQTLDVLEVSKPCIDIEDEGYNVEWSQELKVYQSFDEYLRAWILIHALHHKLGFPGESPGIVFNLSVGYNLKGLRKPNMQWFLDQMADCSDYKQDLVDQLARYYPAVADLDIPDRLSDNVTLSTMHGCPPDEIESISTYLLRDRGLHTLVKCNPTLLGPRRLRSLLNEDLKFTDVVVPDEAFEHDLKYEDAVPMLRNLQATAHQCSLEFGVKLSNTLEVENHRTVFDAAEKMMYLSGRPLHAITVNLASVLAEEFQGKLPMSFSAGANCFNTPSLLAAGMQTVTICSDLLKTGGYLRLLQYAEFLDKAFGRVGASRIDDFIVKSAGTSGDVSTAALANLRRYADETRTDRQYISGTFDTSHTKTRRELGLFDCIKAPCVDECPLDQKAPQYLNATRDGDFDRAARVIRADNPIPCVLGRVCDHLCEPVCVRAHLDEPVAIRDIKRFIMDRERGTAAGRKGPAIGGKVAIIGAGPGGMAAAENLARGGLEVEVFEQHSYAGGMVGGAIPEYRLPQAVFDRDFGLLGELGVKVHYNMRAGRDFRMSDLRREGFDHIVIMVGAQLSKTLRLQGEDCEGVMDALEFLRRSREGSPVAIGKRIGIVGAGDTAMDCARTAWRHSDSSDSKVTLIYRRTIDQMPADREEVAHLIEEGIDVLELANPQRLEVANGKLRALVCRRMRLGGDRDASGRKNPHEIHDSDFEVPLDTLILAISQNAVLDFFDEEPIAVNQNGYIAVDPVTFETSVSGIYAGGDVVNDGPSSIVKAAAEGKAIADAILERDKSEIDPAEIDPAETAPSDPTSLIRRRAHRDWRVPAQEIPLDERRNFKEVVQTYTECEARAEAARCLDCDTYCSLCVGVCPNLALQTYQTEKFEMRLPVLRFEAAGLQAEVGEAYRVAQSSQVAVLADFCNECGNCTTFCPTAGRPFNDKPLFFLDRSDFEQQDDNAFMLFRDEGGWAMEARWGGATHRITLNGTLDYTAPSFRARLDPDTFEVVQAEPDGGARVGDTLSLEPCAAMYVLLRGVEQSMAHWPTALSDEIAARSKIAHPGYEE